ncbi:hypothetical protein [Flavobacterium sp. 3HN19-14]|uniref:hypothetical protein n=1 Tax=Flavobacterium sp. 3HN19-14 TaxID=3448133 RepID=UPI003EE39E52
MPNGITAFSWYGSNGSNGSGGALQDTLPTLAVGETVTYTITLDVPSGFTGSFDEFDLYYFRYKGSCSGLFAMYRC